MSFKEKVQKAKPKATHMKLSVGTLVSHVIVIGTKTIGKGKTQKLAWINALNNLQSK